LTQIAGIELRENSLVSQFCNDIYYNAKGATGNTHTEDPIFMLELKEIETQVGVY